MDPHAGDRFETPWQRWLQLWPFMFAFGLGFALAWLGDDGPLNTDLLLVAGAVIVLVGVSIIAGAWNEVPELLTLVPVVGLCVAVDLMRAASGGGASAGYGSLLLIPVIWQAMRRRQLELTLTIVLVSVANVVAVVFLASPVSPSALWRSIILFTVVAATIGQTVHRLVAARSELVQQLSDLARLDALTGLANRRAWDERVPEEVEIATRRGLPLAIAILDLDRFKAFNDQHGHQHGDELLTRAATAWSTRLRTGDLLARWGGEEFALLMPATDADEAAAVLGRLQGVTPEGQTFSAGYVVERWRPGFEPDLDAVLRAADAALYTAKATGRSKAVLAADHVNVRDHVDAPGVVAPADPEVPAP